MTESARHKFEIRAPMRPLKTARLLLSPLMTSDAEIMFEPLQDVELYRYLGGSPPASKGELIDRYARLEQRCSPDEQERWLNWIVRRQGSSQPLGFVQATVELNDHAEIAYLLFRHAWGHGYALEAVQAMIEELSCEGVVVLTACADRGNAQSRTLLEKLGFVTRSASSNLTSNDLQYTLNRAALA